MVFFKPKLVIAYLLLVAITIEFSITIGLHQGLVLSRSYLFALVIDEPTEV